MYDGAYLLLGDSRIHWKREDFFAILFRKRQGRLCAVLGFYRRLSMKRDRIMDACRDSLSLEELL